MSKSTEKDLFLPTSLNSRLAQRIANTSEMIKNNEETVLRIEEGEGGSTSTSTAPPRPSLLMKSKTHRFDIFKTRIDNILRTEFPDLVGKIRLEFCEEKELTLPSAPPIENKESGNGGEKKIGAFTTVKIGTSSYKIMIPHPVSIHNLTEGDIKEIVRTCVEKIGRRAFLVRLKSVYVSDGVDQIFLDTQSLLDVAKSMKSD
nr:MAG: hypothetical protein [Rhabdoviridae sp.]